jgi:membrane associated rhomboid family serine protease
MGFNLSWFLLYVLLLLTGRSPGAFGAPVAWEAHIIGYFAGLLLISPFAWAAGAHAEMTP